MNVFISLQLTKNDAEILPTTITSKKVSKNNVHILTRQIKLKEVRRNNVDFLTIEIKSKKSAWKQRGFFDDRNYIGKST